MISNLLGSNLKTFYYPTTVAIYEQIELTPELDTNSLAFFDLSSFMLVKNDNEATLFNYMIAEILFSYTLMIDTDYDVYQAVFEEVNSGIVESLIGANFNKYLTLLTKHNVELLVRNIRKYVRLNTIDRDYELVFIGWRNEWSKYHAGFIFI